MAIVLPDNFARGLPCSLPLSHVAEIVTAPDSADVLKHTRRKRAARELFSLGNKMTPYGPIIEKLKRSTSEATPNVAMTTSCCASVS